MEGLIPWSGTKDEYKEHIREHRQLFKHFEKKIYGKVSYRSYLHDLDKLILLKFINNVDLVRRIHRYYSAHHLGGISLVRDYKATLIDWFTVSKRKRNPIGSWWVDSKINYDKKAVKVINKFMVKYKIDKKWEEV